MLGFAIYLLPYIVSSWNALYENPLPNHERLEQELQEAF